MPYVEKSLSLDGTKYVTLGDVLGDVTAWDQDWSLTIWFKTTDTGYTILASKAYDDATAPGWQLAYGGATGYVQMLLRNDQSVLPPERLQVNSTATGLGDGEWHMATFTWRGTSGPSGANAKLYVDSVEGHALGDDNLSGAMANSGPFLFGGRYQTFVNLFVGNLALGVLHNKVLSAAEVSDLYNGGNPVDPKKLSSSDAVVEAWPLGTGDTHPHARAVGQAPAVPWKSGIESPYRKLLEESSPVKWLRANTARNRDMDPFYPGPGGFCPLACRNARADNPGYFRGGPIWQPDYQAPFSIATWIRWSDTANGWYGFVTAAPDDYHGVFLRPHYYSAGSVEFRLSGGNANEAAVYTTALFNDGNWHLIVGTYDGTEYISGMHIWVDGVDQPLTTYRNEHISSLPVGSFCLGSIHENEDWGYNGHQAQVLVVNKELSGAEVAALYNSGTPVDPTGLAFAGDIELYYPLGSSVVGGTEEDRVDGTLLNMDSSDVVAGPGGVLVNALRFDGVDQSVTFDNRFNLEKDQPFSIFFWFKTSSSGAGYIVAKMSTGSTGYETVISSGTIYWELINSAANRARIYTNTSTFNDGNWHSCCVSSDGSGLAAGLTISVDGAAQAVTSDYDTLGSNTILSSGDLRIACRGSLNTDYLDGDVAAVSFYATELQPADVTALHNGGTPVDPTSLASADYLVGYWQIGDGFYGGTMVGMSSGDIVDDAPAASTVTLEKTWTTTANYDIAYSSQRQQAQDQLMDWKNKLTTIGYTVLGSGNSTVYEWAGDTGGGSYGGQSTGPYDVWAAASDIVYRDSSSGLGPMGWAVLEGPVTAAGQFWVVIAYYADFDYSVRAFATNAKPTLPADPLNDYPRASTDEWFWICADQNFYRPGSTTIRLYFSGCATDGSFVFLRWRPSEGYLQASQQFHVMTTSEMEPDNFSMRAAGLAWTIPSAPQDQWQAWRIYDPVSGPVGSVHPVGWGDYPTIRELEQYTEDYLRGTMQTGPMILVHNPELDNSAGIMYVKCRVPDVYLHHSSIAVGSQAPAAGTPKLVSTGSMWVPGDTGLVLT